MHWAILGKAYLLSWAWNAGGEVARAAARLVDHDASAFCHHGVEGRGELRQSTINERGAESRASAEQQNS